MQEKNIEVDKNDNIIDFKPKNYFYKSNLIHRSSHLILFNSKNEILLLKVNPKKILYSNLYSFSVNGFVKNETYEECIK
jgi:isopentenyldiphosphate isomerase